MSHVQKQASHIAPLYQSFQARWHVIEQSHGITEEINWAYDSCCLTADFLLNVTTLITVILWGDTEQCLLFHLFLFIFVQLIKLHENIDFQSTKFS